MKTTLALFLSLTLTAASFAAEVTVTATLESPVVVAGQKEITYLKIGLKGFSWDVAEAKTPPLNVAIVLDRSGSMEGEKLMRAKTAAKLAVSRLTSRDILSLVTYETDVRVDLPATRVTDKASINRLIDAIETDGSTALFAGVSKGAAEVRKFLSKETVNRVILLSDGLANVGPDSPDALASLGSSLRKEGISVSTIGLGVDYNEDLMTQLAQASDGNHAFVQEPRDLARIFDLEFRDAMTVVAKDINVQIDFQDGFKPLRILNREGKINGRNVLLDLSQLTANQEKYFLVEVETPALTAGSLRSVCSVKTSYQNMTSRQNVNQVAKAEMRASTNLAEIKQNRHNDVVEAVAVQKSVEARQRALELRDAGKTEEAKKVLEENADQLKRTSQEIQSAPLSQAAEKSEKDAKEIADDKADYNVLRKSMKAGAYSDANQQSY